MKAARKLRTTKGLRDLEPARPGAGDAGGQHGDDEGQRSDRGDRQGRDDAERALVAEPGDVELIDRAGAGEREKDRDDAADEGDGNRLHDREDEEPPGRDAE